MMRLKPGEFKKSYLRNTDSWLSKGEAYLTVPFHLDNQPLLALEWDNRICIDRALPFGLKSTPKFFSTMADGIQWISSITLFGRFYFSSKNPIEAGAFKHKLMQIWFELGMPLELSKLNVSRHRNLHYNHADMFTSWKISGLQRSAINKKLCSKETCRG